MGHTIQQAPRLIEAPQRIDIIISQAVWEFAKHYPSWQAHVRYHDEPLWILRQEEKEVIKRVQIALFSNLDEVHLYLIPDRSDLVGEKRIKFRRNFQIDVPYKELLSYTAKDIETKIDTLVKKYLS